MSKEDELRAAAQFIANQQRSTAQKNPGQWLWEAIQGDFNQGRSGGQIGFDAAISMIPGVDQVCDLRDLVANCILIKKAPGDGWNWVSLGLTLIGLFPTLGSPVKGVLKIFVLFIRNAGADKVAKGIDAGLTWAVTWLRKKEVQKYLELQKIDEIFGWLASQFKALRSSITAKAMLAEFDKAIGVLKGLLGKVAELPYVGAKAKETIALVEEVRKLADANIGKSVKPIQEILDKIIEALERKHLLTRHGITDLHNIHFKGGLPEAQAVTLMRTKRPRPKWLSEGRKATWKAASPKKYRSEVDKASSKNLPAEKRFPKLTDTNIESFHSLKAVPIKGPAKLYRVVSPSNAAMADCWIPQDVWEKIIAAPDPKAAWRKYLGVWPDWNPNGQFVVMEIPAGKMLNVWRGPTASQVKDAKKYPDLDVHLEGGYDQVIYKPVNNSEWDTTTYFERTVPNADVLVRTDMRREAYEALHDADKARYLGLREKINDPRILGPLDTGWGYTDFDVQLSQANVGLPDLPGQLTNH